jgi:hypothetical protein
MAGSSTSRYSSQPTRIVAAKVPRIRPIAGSGA